MKKFGILIMAPLFILLSASFLYPALASAQTGGNSSRCSGESAGFLSFPTWYKYLNPRIVTVNDDGEPIPPTCEVDFEIDNPAKIGAVLLAVFEIILRVAVLVAIVFIIWGGVQLQLSQGEPDRFSNARTTVINALIGLVIVISAVAMVNFVGNNLR